MGTSQLTHARDVNHSAAVNEMEGHGKAWHRMASMIEHTALELFGLPLKLGSFSAIPCHWEKLEDWPRVEDMKVWKLTGEKYDEFEEWRGSFQG
jgi:hypothetical protein